MQATDFASPFASSIADARLKLAPPGFRGHSAAARRVQSMILRAARTNLPVLLVGPRGCGKETVARILHHFGGGEVPNIEIVEGRQPHQLVSLGAFTYLRRLEDLTMGQQRSLPELTGLGRIVIGTEVSPESEAGRERLHPQVVRWASGVRIDMPGLAERIEDLEFLALDLLAEIPTRRPIGGISDAALNCLRTYRWPGNIDELRDVLTEAVANGSTELIELKDLPAKIRLRDVHQVRVHSPERQLCLEEAEKQAIRRALAYAKGNKRKAARLLHIGKTTLYRKLAQYGLE